MCPGTACFKVAKHGQKGFEEVGPVEVIGYVTCGGCPGKEILSRSEKMVEKGAEIIVLSSCIVGNHPGGRYYPCPFLSQIRSLLQTYIGQETQIIYGTH